jgi:hypothetical protein
MRLALLALLLSSAACTGDDGANANPQCTGKIYDLCHDEHDCTDDATLCRPFDGGIYCTTGCTPGDDTSCPKQHGKVVTCNAQSLCEAAAPNACILGATD